MDSTSLTDQKIYFNVIIYIYGSLHLNCNFCVLLSWLSLMTDKSYLTVCRCLLVIEKYVCMILAHLRGFPYLYSIDR